MIKRTSRDNARTPMQWNDSENAGFSTVKPWLKVNKNYKEVNVENQQFDENSVFSFWKTETRLPRLRSFATTRIKKGMFTWWLVLSFSVGRGMARLS